MSDAEVTRKLLVEARSLLSKPLNLLQGFAHPTLALAQATEFLADATSALYEAESLLGTAQDERATRSIRQATETLGRSLELVESEAKHQRHLDSVSESIARALALVYPVAQSRVRRRRAVMLGEPGLDTPLAYVPKAPEPLKQRVSSVPAARPHAKNRRGTPRAMLEVDIGLLSHSHFYTGLSMDVSKGGLFVATYEPLAVGTLVTLFFVLPNGRAVEAPGTVRWTRAGTEDSPPGMGVAFEALNTEARNAIAGFCEQRSPLFHDSADE